MPPHEPITPASAEKFLPHWIWFVGVVFTPFLLIVLGFLGAGFGGLVPAEIAAACPRVAVSLSAIGMAAAVVRRRRAAIALAALGLSISLGGLLLLWWLSSTEATSARVTVVDRAPQHTHR